MNNIMVINTSNKTRSAEDGNLLIACRDAESKISSIFLIPLLRRCRFLFNSSCNCIRITGSSVLVICCLICLRLLDIKYPLLFKSPYIYKPAVVRWNAKNC